MIAKVACGALHGVDAFRVDLEVDLTRSGIPAFTMVGLAEGAVREARDRVFSALRNSGCRIPPGRITVNLAPADRKKGGSSYDLPLAVGLMCAADILPSEAAEGFFMAGELSLNGELCPAPGMLPIALLARAQNARGLIAPVQNADEAAVVEGLKVYALTNLAQVRAFLAGEIALSAHESRGGMGEDMQAPALDYADVKGQEHAKRAVEVAAAGGHNLLFIGPPGSGKTMLAQRLPGILPRLEFEESLEVTKIYSVAGLLPANMGIMRERPFRAPHHNISQNGLVGGGAYPRPGELSLAHRGVLFLDELPEFSKHSLESLRQPLENGSVTIARAALSVTYPAEVMLVAAMNPCPCGYLTDSRKACVCSRADVQRYHARLSGPLLDRIDLHVEAPAVPYEDLSKARSGRSSAEMRQSVLAARERQNFRYKGSACRCNAALAGADFEKWCKTDSEGRSFMEQATNSLRLSARAYTRVFRIARTIADLEGRENVTAAHLAEAVNCRTLDRGSL